MDDRNSVAANLVFAFLIIGGLVFTSKFVKKSSLSFLWTSLQLLSPILGEPEEVEKGVVLAVEEGDLGHRRH